MCRISAGFRLTWITTCYRRRVQVRGCKKEKCVQVVTPGQAESGPLLLGFPHSCICWFCLAISLDSGISVCDMSWIVAQPGGFKQGQQGMGGGGPACHLFGHGSWTSDSFYFLKCLERKWKEWYFLYVETTWNSNFTVHKELGLDTKLTCLFTEKVCWPLG